EEILHDVEPVRRYGVAVLHPAREEPDPLAGAVGLATADETSEGNSPPAPEIQGAPADPVEVDADDFDLSLANAYQPSAMAISLRARLPAGSRLVVEGAMGRYEQLPIQVAETGSTRDWWVRRPVRIRAAFEAEALTSSRSRALVHPAELSCNAGNLDLKVEAFSRPAGTKPDPDPEIRLVTISLVNRTASGRGPASCLFQAGFSVSATGGAAILPYPERRSPASPGSEEESIALLYRRYQTFAVGHGCAADWEPDPGDEVRSVQATCLPTCETPSITPVITTGDGDQRRELRVSLEALADEQSQARAGEQVTALMAGYESWIRDRRRDAQALPQCLQAAATRHLGRCDAVLARMHRGWSLVQTNAQIGRAFRLANRAMLVQQARSDAPLRPVTMDEEGMIRVAGAPPSGEIPPGRGHWRPFQIAFFLAVLESVADPASDDRETVELIFFPTGGGKTEAYLAVAAFSMFLRRLRDPGDAGTDVLMRYTLRLLTAQQFLRAATLVCAMEQIRRYSSDLGDGPFSIGIWLGGSSTPNRRPDAVAALNRMLRDSRSDNEFLLLRCPWCATQMGPVQGKRRIRGRDAPAIAGYERVRDRVIFACPDRTCEFGSRQPLPVYVVDDDIYEFQPTLVIGTVDKFAMLPWRPQARALFGIDRSGARTSSPPGIIIQDELHLIAGPLGSMVGLYEAVIEDLCTDHRTEPEIRPKIIASTATIRRHEEQICGIYGRDRSTLFPPPGIDVADSYFATYAVDRSGAPRPGRQYVGVHAPALGSIQTAQVRVAAALLQAPEQLAEDQRDPWWTNVWFFNSLRELGNTVSLLQSDIPDYLTGIRNRDGIDAVRWPRNVMELTSRRRNDEIPRAIEELSQAYGSGAAIDVCLASNIIEVGIDIDRLSLMTIVGQPKTTAQYIQVSGRVGRRWWERPGLIVTIYGASKPRDRSHFERFRSYHERLYARVEPTSVTPFALPVVDRALHAALVAHVRIAGPSALDPYPPPEVLVDAAARILRARASSVDPAELAHVEATLSRRLREWRAYARTAWDANPVGGEPLQGLMRFAGIAEAPGIRAPSWEVPTSMRNVDAECVAEVTLSYAHAEAEEQA
ncbi:MAG TPA: helicase-related protein, partial [Streptosporangiaceae bacterium]